MLRRLLNNCDDKIYNYMSGKLFKIIFVDIKDGCLNICFMRRVYSVSYIVG